MSKQHTYFRETFVWVQRKFLDTSRNFTYGLNAAAKKYDGHHKYLRITDINDQLHTFSQENLTSPDYPVDQLEDYKMDSRSIVYVRTGASTGKTYVYSPLDGDLYFAGFLIRHLISPKFSPQFIFQKTLTNSWYNYVKIVSQRSGQPGINSKEIGEFFTFFPNLDEQNIIGSFFKNQDFLIAAYQRKISLLERQKQGYLQQMFSQKLRFKGYSTPWVQRNLTDLADVKTGFPFASGDFTEDGQFEVVTNAHIQSDNHDVLSRIGDRIDIEDENRLSYVLNPGDILVTMDGTVGRTAVVRHSNQILAQRVGRLLPNQDKKFMYSWLTTGAFFNAMLKKSHGGTIKHISLSEIASYRNYVPENLAEQESIGHFFEVLDNLIAAYQRKVTLLQQQKQAYLQKMFI